MKRKHKAGVLEGKCTAEEMNAFLRSEKFESTFVIAIILKWYNLEKQSNIALTDSQVTVRKDECCCILIGEVDFLYQKKRANKQSFSACIGRILVRFISLMSLIFR